MIGKLAGIISTALMFIKPKIRKLVIGDGSVKQKSIKTYKKKTNLKTSLNNLETSKPDFLRNSIAYSSVKTC